MAESNIKKALELAQYPETNVRLQAELELKTLETLPDFPLYLTNIAASRASIPLRLGSLIYLQRFITHHWSPLFEQFQEGPIPDENIKRTVKEILLRQLLSLENHQLNKAVAYAVSLIANVDFPDEWPEVFPCLLQLLESNNENSINAALDVLCELIDESLVEEQFFIITPRLSETLYQLVLPTPPNDSLRKLQARAIGLFRSCLELLEMYKETRSEPVRVFVDRLLPPWMDLFTQKLQSPLFQGNELLGDSTGTFCIMGEISLSLSKLRELFPSKLSTYVVRLVDLIWDILQKLLPIYLRDVVFGNPVNENVFGIEFPFRYLIELLQFVGVALQNKSVQALFLATNASSSSLPPCISILVQYAQLSKGQVELYENDVNEYIVNETNYDSIVDTVRGAAVNVLSSFEQHTNLGLQQHIRELAATYVLQNDINWVDQEALLYACCSIDATSDDTYDDFLEPVYKAISVRMQTSNVPEILMAGFFNFVGYFSESTPLAIEFFQIFLNCISNAAQSDLVKYAAIKGIERLCSVSEIKPSTSVQPAVLQVLREFVQNSYDESLVLLVEAITALARLDCEKAAEPDSSFIPVLFNLIANNPSDPYLSGLIEDTFEDLTSEAASYESVCEITMPELLQVLSHPDPNLVNVGCTLLSSLIRAGPSPLPNGFINYVLPPIYQITETHNDDLELLQLSQEIIRELLRKDCPQVLRSEISGATGLQYILYILQKLLLSKSDDSSCFLVGTILLELLEHANQALDLHPVLLSCLQRAVVAEQPRFIQSIIYVFSKMINKNAEAVLNFLSGCTLDDRGTSALEALMQVWCDNYVYFSNFKNLSVICIAMTNIYKAETSLLDAIQVKGDIISQSDRIVTRSQSRLHPNQYTSINVREKLIKLLLDEYISLFRESIVEEVSNDEGDDWDDGPSNVEEDFGLSADEINELAKDEFPSVKTPAEGEDDTADLQFHLLDFFKSAMAANLNNFNDCASRLTVEQQAALANIK
ncbi:karyopherin/importin beta family nuclear import signal receptor Kap14 [Schizosaccharomyces osmophilus]|uniref:Karyopherin/importin beta family nuclear import signal receptor Kap14 n=1 Tax=Schizosaccharomyces osmophilus TaxID=2545709 RepID=A0AAE9WF98_9SCHI|nr:karyopherin/importin beta family nuclear import signal receptor Kap14 [Schizosaccharomyces osmophilus]WBW73703.1 karyopherin/importin beta family nuclear import signal receptor Kap14 [Schizosaccharomyces osmophilus]